MDIYGIAWRNLAKKIAASRRKAIHKSDLIKWQLEALEEAIDQTTWDTVTAAPRVVISDVLTTPVR